MNTVWKCDTCDWRQEGEQETVYNAWTQHRDTMQHDEVSMLSINACDFCGERGDLRRYDIDPFALALPDTDAPALLADAGWGACYDCEQLIEQGKQRELTQRFLDRYDGNAATVAPIATAMHQTFLRLLREQRARVR
jgi:hypothetical protein